MKPQLASDVTVVVGPGKHVTAAAVYFFDLDRVLRHLGSSRLTQTERLHAICERHVRFIVGTDLVLFSDRGFYLVVTSCSGSAAAGLASFINVSLLMLLFGTESLSPDQNITMYRQIDSDDLPAIANIKMLEMAQSLLQHEDGYDSRDEGSIDEDNRQGGNDALVRLARDGAYVEQGIELSFFPVHDLRRKAVSTLFCVPTFAGAEFGHQAFRSLNPSLLPYIDRAMLTHSLAFARRLAEAGIVMAVGAPVSFETLAWSKSRQIYQWALRAANLAQNPQLILKIEDIPPGTPADRIAQVVSGVRPFARHIFVHLPNNHVEFGMTGRIGASGLVLSLPRRAPLPEVLADSRWLSRAAITQNAMSCIDHVESDEALSVVRNAGIRFAVGHVFGAETVRGTAPIDAVRDTLDRIGAATTAHLRAVV